MIRTRNPRRDDRTILQLVKQELFPYTLLSFPGLRWNAAEIRKRLAGNVTYVAVPRRSAAAGFASVRTAGKELYLDMLAVAPARRGQGWGKALLAESERHARGKGYRQLSLYVNDANANARLFYARHGYAEAGYFPAIQCYKMVKTW
jgi:ribosomal protein S18 acetylase RimI-like enzyme